MPMRMTMMMAMLLMMRRRRTTTTMMMTVNMPVSMRTMSMSPRRGTQWNTFVDAFVLLPFTQAVACQWNIVSGSMIFMASGIHVVSSVARDKTSEYVRG